MDPITVLPPLRGEWNVINTPGDRVPNHGSHQWGLAYAYDFIKLKAYPVVFQTMMFLPITSGKK